ncbi:hypothetical protein [Staphylococcus pseudintermedius]|uniref:hypothetical protein n=1 Tax=Staphylococcus pseudintermedius TaxID=283734 RepID=UPI001A7E21C4|nr:hypothetical protein [Staphylococcus pseudintermedius]
MKSASQLLEEVKNERNREDKFLCEIQFEVRRNEVTMFFGSLSTSVGETITH